MSMSQEEIEALMNGLDFDDSEESNDTEVEESESQGNMSVDDINELIAQTEDVSKEEETTEVEDISKNEKIDDILSGLESIDSEEVSEETNIDDILKELENDNPDENLDESSEDSDKLSAILDNSIVQEDTPSESIPNEETSTEEVSSESTPSEETSIEEISHEDEDFEDILSGIEGLEGEEPQANLDGTEKKDNDIDHKINSGVFPLPAEEDTKVVNQLSIVANDSEEKATRIFDVLSNILDYNNAIQQDINALNSFNEKQVEMLSSLSKKFPNIGVFAENLKAAEQMGEHINDANAKLNDGNTEIFQAMELMQFHDINRQKIERVMSVIRKLSVYLNNLFEDGDNRAEVAVAKHIHGDSTEDLVGDDDLEALIAEFNK